MISHIRQFLSLLLPHHCLFCAKKDYTMHPICNSCLKNMKPFSLKKVEKNKAVMSIIPQIYCGWIYDDFMKSCLAKIKFENQKKMLKFLLKLIRKSDFHTFANVDMVTYIPLHNETYIKRGFNQSKIIAQMISKIIDKPVVHLFRRKDDRKQSLKNRENRLNNLFKANFKLKKRLKLNHRKILLVDDIVTTGATLASCTKLLKNNENIKVVCFALISSELD